VVRPSGPVMMIMLSVWTIVRRSGGLRMSRIASRRRSVSWGSAPGAAVHNGPSRGGSAGSTRSRLQSVRDGTQTANAACVSGRLRAYRRSSRRGAPIRTACRTTTCSPAARRCRYRSRCSPPVPHSAGCSRASASAI
jgi:hypothetical protein